MALKRQAWGLLEPHKVTHRPAVPTGAPWHGGDGILLTKGRPPPIQCPKHAAAAGLTIYPSQTTAVVREGDPSHWKLKGWAAIVSQ